MTSRLTDVAKLNNILEKNIEDIKPQDEKIAVDALIDRLKIEFKKNDKSGIYAISQYELAYNSNRIEGSCLSKDQTIALFETHTLGASEEYRAKDVEETTGHFLMFNEMLKTLDMELSEEMIKKFHYELKAGVFEDRANGYNIGEYKARRNIVGGIHTALPQDVPQKMKQLLEKYKKMEKNIETMAVFHAEYESIHPFQDGNGRTGRMILFRECIKNGIIPPIIKSEQRVNYSKAFQQYNLNKDISELLNVLKEAQRGYYSEMKYFLEESIL